MEIISPVHGRINYNEEDIIRFKKGIPGFEGLTKYVTKEIEKTPFMLLQSIEENEVSFVVISPFTVEKNYEIKLSEEIIKKLNIENSNDVLLYSIVTLNSKVENITVNLKAPLVVNIKGKLGEQFIVDKEKYKIKHPFC